MSFPCANTPAKDDVFFVLNEGQIKEEADLFFIDFIGMRKIKLTECFSYWDASVFDASFDAILLLDEIFILNDFFDKITKTAFFFNGSL